MTFFFVQRSHLNYNYKIRPISDGYIIYKYIVYKKVIYIYTINTNTTITANTSYKYNSSN